MYLTNTMNKTQQLHLRTSKPFMDSIKTAANKRGMDVSEYVRYLVHLDMDALGITLKGV